MNVLIVEDDEFAREASARYLHHLGHEVCAAASGQEAEAKADDRPPDVVICDWRLADGDAQGADSIARLARAAAAIDSLALVRSALVGRAELLRARALRARGDTGNSREAAARAAVALAGGYGPRNSWTRAAQSLVDSLSR